MTTQTPVSQLSDQELREQLEALDAIVPDVETLFDELHAAHEDHATAVEIASTDLNTTLTAVESHASAFEADAQRQIMSTAASE